MSAGTDSVSGSLRQAPQHNPPGHRLRHAHPDAMPPVGQALRLLFYIFPGHTGRRPKRDCPPERIGTEPDPSRTVDLLRQAGIDTATVPVGKRELEITRETPEAEPMPAAQDPMPLAGSVEPREPDRGDQDQADEHDGDRDSEPPQVSDDEPDDDEHCQADEHDRNGEQAGTTRLTGVVMIGKTAKTTVEHVIPSGR